MWGQSAMPKYMCGLSCLACCRFRPSAHQAVRATAHRILPGYSARRPKRSGVDALPPAQRFCAASSKNLRTESGDGPLRSGSSILPDAHEPSPFCRRSKNTAGRLSSRPRQTGSFARAPRQCKRFRRRHWRGRIALGHAAGVSYAPNFQRASVVTPDSASNVGAT